MKIRRSSILKVLFISCLSTFILAVFLLTFKVNGFCAGADSGSYFPIEQNKNGHFSDTVINAIESRYNPNDEYFYICMYVDYNYRVIRFPKTNSDSTLCGEIFSNGYQFSIYQYGSINNLSGFGFQYAYNQILNEVNYGSNPFGYFYGLPSSLYNSGYDYISNFNVYTNTSSSKSLVIYFEDDDPNYDVPLTGHATPYDPLNIPTYTQGHTAPSNVPPTHNSYHYTWNTYNPPSIDTTDLVSTMESVGDIITYSYGYLKDNISNEFSNLIDNIVSTGNFIAETIQYYGNLLVSGINNFIKNFYDNMVSLLEPISIPFLTIIAMGTDPDTGLFSIPYLTQVLLVPDAVNVVELIAANDEFDLIESGKIIVTSFPLIINQLTSVSPTPTFHFPSCYYHGQQIGDFDISFSWFNNYKLYYDILINGFLIIGYLYWLFVSFSSHMRGVFLPEQSDDAYQRHNIGF